MSEIDLRALRKKTGLNQSQFYARLGVTQSGGSRYEAGRNVPKPVQMLAAIAYGTERQRAKALAQLTFADKPARGGANAHKKPRKPAALQAA